MNLRACTREAEVQAALRAGRWPAACDPALRQHVAECRNCADLVLVMQVFQQTRADARAEALPAPGTLWWRAQLRRRQQAVEQATRPIVLAEVAAFAAVLAAFVLAGWRWWQADARPEWLANVSPALRREEWLAALANASPFVLLGGAFTLLLLFSGVLLYVAAARD